MQNKLVAILVLIISSIVLSMFVMKINKDITYFSSKKMAVASIMEISDPGPQNPYRVTLQYFNEYLGRDTTCTINVKKSYGKKIKEENSKTVNINYGRNFPSSVYLVDFETPNIGIILFDLSVIVIMITSVVLSLKDLIKKQKYIVQTKVR